MSGGIKYRLTTQERNALAEQLGVLEGLRARLGSSGIDAKLGDSQLEVSVEETPEGPRFEIEYPFDNDLISENGRIYVKDVFKLSKQADKILSFDRSLHQEIHTNKKFRFWVDLASKDHPDAKITSHPEHLRRLLEDLGKVPKPTLNGQPLQRFLQGALQRLHRPFPDGNEGLVRKNFAVFKNVLDRALPFGMRMKFNDPQSGLKLRQEGDRLFLGLQVVFDTDSTPGREAEKNGRIYLLDTYEIESSSGKVLSAKREIVPSEVSTPAFDQTYAAIKDSAGPLPISEELQELANGWVKGLIPSQTFTPPSPTSTPAVIAEAPKDPAGKLLYNLFLFTSQDEKAGTKFFEAMAQRPSTGVIPSKLSLSEMDRGALRDALALAIAGDTAELEKTKSAWLSGNQLQPATQSLLEALSQYASGDFQGAIRTLGPVSELSPFALQVIKAAKIRQGQSSHAQATEILKIAVAERLEQASRQDRAWLRAISDGLSGNSQADPELRRLAILSFFKKFEAKLETGGGDLASIASDTPATDAYEREVSSYLVRDPAVRELMAWLEEPDANLRNEGLLRFGRGLLTGKEKLPATAKKIAESLAPSTPGVSEFNQWFSGQANFGQKIEVLLPAFVEEAISPHTIVSMTAAGALGRIAKATFFSRVGFQTRRLRWAAEAVSIGAEAPAFVLSDKLLLSAFDSPEGQWDKLPRDTLGALVAFGTLRGAGIAAKRFENFLSGSKGFETWSAGRSRMALAERWLPRVEKFAESEGKARWLRRNGGKQAVALLNYVGKTGLPREWTRKTLPFLSVHGAGIGGLMAANSLTRLIGLREPSKQGWTSDLVDDSLMYGHFLIAGHLAGKLGTRSLDARLAYLESQPLEVKAPASKLEIKEDKPTEEPQKPLVETEAAEPAPEKLPAVDLPPEVKEFGKTIAKWWRDGMPEIRRLGSEWFQAALARIRKGKPQDPALSDPKPEISEAETAIPAKETVPPEAPGDNPVASSPGEISDASPTLIPEKPAGAPIAFLAPVPEAVHFRRVTSRPTESGKGKEFKVDVEILGRVEEIRFKEKESRQEVTFEAIIGREDIQSPAQAVGIDFGFPSTETHIAPNHAKIRVKVIFETRVEEKVEPSESRTETKPVKRKVGRAIPKEWQVSLEDMGSSSGTFLNGKRVTGSVRLKDQDQLRLGNEDSNLKLRLDPTEWKAFLIRPNLQLREGKDSWTLGREHAGADLPDLRFPLSERDVSRRHARIVRDGEGNFFVQDLSWNGTRVNMRRIHGSRPLRDGDLLQLGNGTEMTFTLPSETPTRDSVPPEAYPQHPNLSASPPEQASVHPAYRFVNPASLEAYILQFATKGDDPSAFRAGQLRLPDGRDIFLSSLNTGWTIGHEGKAAPNTQSLDFSSPASVAKNPALLYLDSAGRFILRSLHPEGKISIQTRGERFLPPNGEAKRPSAFKNRVSGWTVLEGGERVFLGDDFYFDFWPGSPNPPPERPTTYTEEITPLAPETKAAEAESAPTISKPEYFKDGKLILSSDKAFRLRSQANLTEIQIGQNSGGGEIEILVPESMAKVQETRFFQEGGAWKIRSEGGEGNPLIVNGMRLPAKMTLDLLNDTTLQIGETKIQVRMP